MEQAQAMLVRPVLYGTAAFVLLLVVYFAVVGAISGIQALVKQHAMSGKVVAVSGTTSTAAMVSCCAHYLANIVPVLGVAGFFTVVAQYQIELFWVGLAFNVAGILYIAPKAIRAAKEYQTC